MSHTILTHRARVSLIATVLLIAGHANAAEPASEPVTPAAAHQAYYFARYDQALRLYEQLAAQGNAEAAERAGYMLLQGPSSYGPRVQRDVVRATALLEQAAHAGRPHANFLLVMMDGTD